MTTPPNQPRIAAGQRFGRFITVSRVAEGLWLCDCDCGNRKVVWSCHLKSGMSKSCGCTQQVDRASVEPPRNGPVGGSWVALGRGAFALIDATDAALVGERCWTLSRRANKLYATSRGVYLHRVILGAPRGQEVDHINGDGLDNRRSNLRLCNRSENARNATRHFDGASGFKGVCRNKNGKRWLAQIFRNGSTARLGVFDTAEDAARAYDRASVRLDGEFARPNFPTVRPCPTS